jgi:hypothetical protein
MGSKKIESLCLEKMLKSNTIGAYAKSIHRMIKDGNDEKCIESERPDFVFLSNGIVIGLEHFLVDSLYNQQEMSHSRQKNANIKHAVDNYAKHQDLDKGLVEMKSIFQNDFDAISRFDYKVFIKNFREICMNHNVKCNNGTETSPCYRDKLKDYNGKDTKLGCLIEIPLVNTRHDYVLTRGNHTYRQILNDIPYTKDTIQILGEMNGFDFVIVCVYCKGFTKAAYFNTADVMSGIKEQNIKIYDSFDYYYKPTLDNLDIIKNGDGESYTFKFKGRI